MDAFTKGMKELNEEQKQFICEELGISIEELDSKTEDELDAVYSAMCDIEIEEVCSNESEEDTERCAMASDIVTILGNFLAEEIDFSDEQDDDE